VPTTIWTYPHRDIGEPPLPDGTPIRRPFVPLQVPLVSEDLLAVIDSGSPISVADAQLFKWLGVDIANATPVYEIPLGLGASFGTVPVFQVNLTLRPPDGTDGEPFTWDLKLGARTNWRLPFAVLLGQQGWFDQFRTTIDANTMSVELTAA
jgi:hypothetical protein